MLGRQITFGAIAAVLVGCSTDMPAPTALEFRAPVYAVRANSDINLGTHLTGDEEVPPRVTQAQGQAIFRVNESGSSVAFRLIASNIFNVVQAHIHCGAKGSNGPIVQWLYPNTAAGPALSGPTGRQSGVLASGTFSPNVVCPANSPNGLAGVSLLEAIRAGLTYVNVHTNDGVGATNTGPGDFPGGEIRGQLGDENHSH
jgi:hypothetical protein